MTEHVKVSVPLVIKVMSTGGNGWNCILPISKHINQLQNESCLLYILVRCLHQYSKAAGLIDSTRFFTSAQHGKPRLGQDHLHLHLHLHLSLVDQVSTALFNAMSSSFCKDLKTSIGTPIISSYLISRLSYLLLVLLVRFLCLSLPVIIMMSENIEYFLMVITISVTNVSPRQLQLLM